MIINIISLTIIFFAIWIMIMCSEKNLSKTHIIGEVIDSNNNDGGYVFKDDSGYVYSKYIVFALDEILDKHDMNWTECDKKYEIIIRELE